jgi:hypothetical protein
LAMFSSSPRQRLRIENIDAEAEALIGYFGVEAYCEGRRRERGASSEAIARDWGRVARALARKTKRRIGLETATRMEMYAHLGDRGESANSEIKPQKVDPIDNLKRLISKLE